MKPTAWPLSTIAYCAAPFCKENGMLRVAPTLSKAACSPCLILCSGKKVTKGSPLKSVAVKTLFFARLWSALKATTDPKLKSVVEYKFDD